MCPSRDPDHPFRKGDTPPETGPEPADEFAQELPIDGVLDLHTFHPREVKELVPDYLEECRRRGITEVRIIHGKGTGSLRDLVHAVLKRHPHVTGYALAGDRSGWGATLVTLAPPGDGESPDPPPA